MDDKYLTPKQYSRSKKNEPQFNAVVATMFIFLSGGMKIAWSIGFNKMATLVPLHTRLAWFIGAIVGGVLSCFMANKIPKKIVFCFSSLLVLIGGIIMAATIHNIRALEASLYLDGIANGLAFAPAMALVGEVSLPYNRGVMAAFIEQLNYMCGFYTQISTTLIPSYNTFNAENMQGILSAVCGLIGLIIGSLYCIESPVILLANGNEQEALDALRRLQRPYTMTSETFAQMEEHKHYLQQNRNISTGQSIVQALPAFVRLFYLRALNAMSLSVFLFYTLIISILHNLPQYVILGHYIVYSFCRCLATCITSYCVKSAGRKKSTLLGLLGCGSMSIVIAKLNPDLSNIDYDALCILILAGIAFQVFAGIAFPGTSAYLTEAYPLGVKQPFIAFTFIAEILIYIITSSMTYSWTLYFSILAALCLIGFLLGIWCLPETRETTLREAQDKFKGFLSKGF